VKVGNTYGSVFELLAAKSISKTLKAEPDKEQECVDKYVGLLKKIHSTEVEEGFLPSMKKTASNWADFLKDYLPPKEGEKLKSLIEAVPESNHMLHGDYHTKNVMLQNGEALLIDMDTLCTGNPVFGFASMYNAYIGFGEVDHALVSDFIGIPYELCGKFFLDSVKKYLGTQDEKKVKEVVDKSRILGYTRIIRRTIRRKGLEDPQMKEQVDYFTKELISLLDTTDTLTF
jgi:thiamine kinase-like enzyme